MTAAKKETAITQGAPDLALLKRTTIDKVTERVRGFLESKELHLPKGYSAENALKAAWLVLQDVQDKNGKPALTVCTQNSIANALLSMVVQGLDPMKKQSYFIVRGQHLTHLRSYFGSIAVAKRMAGVKDVYAEAVYEGDAFEYEIHGGIKTVTKHTQSLNTIDPDKIVGGYAVVELEDGRMVTEIMNWKQIKQSWTAGYGNGPQKTQPDEMTRRTVINRATKRYINSSNDDHLGLFLEHYNKSDVEAAHDEIEDDNAQLANREYIDVDVDEAPQIEGAAEEEPGPADAEASDGDGDGRLFEKEAPRSAVQPPF